MRQTTGETAPQEARHAFFDAHATRFQRVDRELELLHPPTLELPTLGDLDWVEQVYRAAERFAALLLLIAVFPIMTLVAFCLLVQGRGTVFYAQERVGINRKPFQIFKFRTMFEDAETQGPFICTSYEDPRITPFGRWLRKSKLDELPQLVNVIRGEMALVGPRPERPCFHKKFSSIPKWEQRISVRPGVTGVAQISRRISHDPEQKLQADLIYIANRSATLDVLLIVYTVLPWVRPKMICGVKMD